jgi:Ca2+-binding EF-hand superfamily protein
MGFSVAKEELSVKAKKEGRMKRYALWSFFMIFIFGCFILTGSLSSAQEKGPPAEMISGAYRQILAGADKNGDGKLSMEECLSVSSNKKKIEKDCKYWDANADGVITEEEYVKQVKKLIR